MPFPHKARPVASRNDDSFIFNLPDNHVIARHKVGGLVGLNAVAIP